MENKQFWRIISILRKVKIQLKKKKRKKGCPCYGEGNVNEYMHQKWFAKPCTRDCSSNNTPQLSRPVEVDSNQIKSSHENKCYKI